MEKKILKVLYQVEATLFDQLLHAEHLDSFVFSREENPPACILLTVVNITLKGVLLRSTLDQGALHSFTSSSTIVTLPSESLQAAALLPLLG